MNDTKMTREEYVIRRVTSSLYDDGYPSPFQIIDFTAYIICDSVRRELCDIKFFEEIFKKTYKDEPEFIIDKIVDRSKRNTDMVETLSISCAITNKDDAEALFKFSIEKFIEFRDSISKNYPYISDDDRKLIYSIIALNIYVVMTEDEKYRTSNQFYKHSDFLKMESYLIKILNYYRRNDYQYQVIYDLITIINIFNPTISDSSLDFMLERLGERRFGYPDESPLNTITESFRLAKRCPKPIIIQAPTLSNYDAYINLMLHLWDMYISIRENKTDNAIFNSFITNFYINSTNEFLFTLGDVEQPKLSFLLPSSNLSLNLYPEDARVILDNLNIIKELANKSKD